MQSMFKEISVDKIILDDKNPRLKFSQIEKNITKWTEKEVSNEIKSLLVFNRLLDSIESYGVIDPIWVHDLDNGYFEVIEGNMRVTALKELLQRKTLPTSKIQYDKVKAHILPKDTPLEQIEIQKAVLQTGKNPWGPFSEAAHIYNLFFTHDIKIDKISNMLGKSTQYISNEIDNYKFYLEFIDFGKKKGNYEVDPRKYSFFKDAGATVKQKFFKSTTSRKDYFKLITPNENGITRIPNVSLKGGLRVFEKIATDDFILNKFLKNDKITIDDAFLELTEKNYLNKIPWIKKISSISKNMNKLNKFERRKILNNYESKKTLIELYKEIKKFFNENEN